MDPITDIFNVIRVESICYGRLVATAPWGLAFRPAEYATFALVADGSGWLHVSGMQAPTYLATGDFFFLAPRRSFTLRSDTQAVVREFDDELRARLLQSLPLPGGGGAAATLVCGKFTFGDTHVRVLADLLPPVIHVPADEARTLAFAQTLELLAAEAEGQSPAARLVMNRLADVLFIQALRAHIASPQHEKTPWVKALADQQMGTSLRSMHGSLERDWTVAALASDVGMSRSSYAQRFKELLGEGPLEYLTRWRMYRGAELLLANNGKLVDVARAVGYDSDSAFQKAFKRVNGVSPGEFRKRYGRRLDPANGGTSPVAPSSGSSLAAMAGSTNL